MRVVFIVLTHATHLQNRLMVIYHYDIFVVMNITSLFWEVIWPRVLAKSVTNNTKNTYICSLVYAQLSALELHTQDKCIVRTISQILVIIKLSKK